MYNLYTKINSWPVIKPVKGFFIFNKKVKKSASMSETISKIEDMAWKIFPGCETRTCCPTAYPPNHYWYCITICNGKQTSYFSKYVIGDIKLLKWRSNFHFHQHYCCYPSNLLLNVVRFFPLFLIVKVCIQILNLCDRNWSKLVNRC